jgi:RNA polymerase sigma-70 factor (ECF subfamily)
VPPISARNRAPTVRPRSDGGGARSSRHRGANSDRHSHQAANDALVNILARLDEFRGLSRFTTWAYKFVMFEVSDKVARHAWRRQPPGREEVAFEQLPDSLAPRPGQRLEQQEQLKALSVAIGELTDRQREVFVPIALNEVPIDVIAAQLGSNRNAIYKTLFDARRNLRARMAAAGHPVPEKDGLMTDLRRLGELLRAKDGDAGCTEGEEILDAYVELELAGEDPARVYPGTRSTFRAAPAAAPITTVCSRRPAGLPTSRPSSAPKADRKGRQDASVSAPLGRGRTEPGSRPTWR